MNKKIHKVDNKNKRRKKKMNTEVNRISINGVEYVPKGTKVEMAENYEGLKYCIVRTYSAGVFAGYVKSRNGQEVVMLKARRLWQWFGAASLSQLAMEGVKEPENCKFPCEVSKVELTQAIEIIEATAEAKKSIDGVAIWKK